MSTPNISVTDLIARLRAPVTMSEDAIDELHAAVVAHLHDEKNVPFHVLGPTILPSRGAWLAAAIQQSPALAAAIEAGIAEHDDTRDEDGRRVLQLPDAGQAAIELGVCDAYVHVFAYRTKPTAAGGEPGFGFLYLCHGSAMDRAPAATSTADDVRLLPLDEAKELFLQHVRYQLHGNVVREKLREYGVNDTTDDGALNKAPHEDPNAFESAVKARVESELYLAIMLEEAEKLWRAADADKALRPSTRAALVAKQLSDNIGAHEKTAGWFASHAIDAYQDRLEFSSIGARLKQLETDDVPPAAKRFRKSVKKWRDARTAEKALYPAHDYGKLEEKRKQKALDDADKAAYVASGKLLDRRLPPLFNKLNYVAAAAAPNGDCFLTSVNVAAERLPLEDGVRGAGKCDELALALRDGALKQLNHDAIHGTALDSWLQSELDGTPPRELRRFGTPGFWNANPPRASAVFQHLVAKHIARPIAVVYNDKDEWHLRVFGDRDDQGAYRRDPDTGFVHCWWNYIQSRGTLEPAVRRLIRQGAVFIKHNGTDHYIPIVAPKQPVVLGDDDGADGADGDDEGAAPRPSPKAKAKKPAKRPKPRRTSDDSDSDDGSDGDDGSASGSAVVATLKRRTRGGQRATALEGMAKRRKNTREQHEEYMDCAEASDAESPVEVDSEADGEEECDGDSSASERDPDPLSVYEEDRLRTMRDNHAELAALGLADGGKAVLERASPTAARGPPAKRPRVARRRTSKAERDAAIAARAEAAEASRVYAPACPRAAGLAPEEAEHLAALEQVTAQRTEPARGQKLPVRYGDDDPVDEDAKAIAEADARRGKLERGEIAPALTDLSSKVQAERAALLAQNVSTNSRAWKALRQKERAEEREFPYHVESKRNLHNDQSQTLARIATLNRQKKQAIAAEAPSRADPASNRALYNSALDCNERRVAVLEREAAAARARMDDESDDPTFADPPPAPADAFDAVTGSTPAPAAAAAATPPPAPPVPPPAPAPIRLPVPLPSRTLQLDAAALKDLKARFPDAVEMPWPASVSPPVHDDGSPRVSRDALIRPRKQRMAGFIAKPETEVEARVILGVYDEFAKRTDERRTLVAFDPTGAFVVQLTGSEKDNRVAVHMTKVYVPDAAPWYEHTKMTSRTWLKHHFGLTDDVSIAPTGW